MKHIIAFILLALAVPAGAQEHRGHEGHRIEGHSHFRNGRDFGHRFHGDHFRFRRGAFYGEIIILDDGCWFWNGFEWVVYADCAEY